MLNKKLQIGSTATYSLIWIVPFVLRSLDWAFQILFSILHDAPTSPSGVGGRQSSGSSIVQDILHLACKTDNKYADWLEKIQLSVEIVTSVMLVSSP